MFSMTGEFASMCLPQNGCMWEMELTQTPRPPPTFPRAECCEIKQIKESFKTEMFHNVDFVLKVIIV